MTNAECISNYFNAGYEIRKVRASLARQCDFAITLDGKGMEPVLHDGQCVLISETQTLDEGEIGLIAYNGHIWVRQYFSTMLRAFNPEGEDFLIKPEDEVTILGRVVCGLQEEAQPKSPIRRKRHRTNKPRPLTDRERDMINRRYVDKQSLEAIGNEYSLTRQRVCQIIKKAMEKLPPDTALPLPN